MSFSDDVSLVINCVLVVPLLALSVAKVAVLGLLRLLVNRAVFFGYFLVVVTAIGYVFFNVLSVVALVRGTQAYFAHQRQFLVLVLQPYQFDAVFVPRRPSLLGTQPRVLTFKLGDFLVDLVAR